jgi:hypothetical protein
MAVTLDRFPGPSRALESPPLCVSPEGNRREPAERRHDASRSPSPARRPDAGGRTEAHKKSNDQDPDLTGPATLDAPAGCE